MNINLDQLRYYLNYILPDIIKNKVFNIIDYMSGALWWVFLLLAVVFAFIILNIYKKMFNMYRERERMNRFLQDISGISNVEEFERKLLDIRLLFKSDYVAFYTLKGETYVLQCNNLETTDKKGLAAANLYIAKNTVKLKSTSGNFIVSAYVAKKGDFLLRLYSRKFINLKLYNGYIEAIFSLYGKLLKNDEITLKVKMSTLTKEVHSIISKSIFSGTGYLSYILSLIKNAIGSAGVKMFENKEEILTLGTIDESLDKKRFYIHNTGYHIDIYTQRNLTVEEMKRVGSFLDMTGIFLSTFNENNNIAKYYVEFLVFANELFENQNVYFRNHTRKVTAVSLEIGKALFLDIEELKYLKLGASLHDIGMIADIGNLIDKNSDLNKEDVSLIKMHPLVGAVLLEPVSNIYPISPIIKYHHEKIDGNGYPFGIVGSEIPQIAQIVGLAEFFVGLISDRSYKKGMPVDKAKELIEQAGRKMYDQTVIDAFLDSIESIEQKFLKIDLETKRFQADKED